jgi:Leucine-rich repeat (LRR) protein
MRNLKVFEVIENPWAMIPEEAIRQNLQIMYMFRVADTSRAGFLTLRGFNISSGGLFALRVALPSVADLRDINLEENKITDFPTYNQPPLIYNRGTVLSRAYRYFSAATQLQTLDLSRNLLQCIPDWVDSWGPGGFQSLKASANFLTALPEAIGAWCMCTTIMLSRNRIKRLPNSISKLTSLTTLWLDVNHLDLITPALSFATRLKSLKLNLNNLTTLPPEMCKLVCLPPEGPSLEGASWLLLRAAFRILLLSERSASCKSPPNQETQ